jgi:hypothetical protein
MAVEAGQPFLGRVHDLELEPAGAVELGSRQVGISRAVFGVQHP